MCTRWGSRTDLGVGAAGFEHRNYNRKHDAGMPVFMITMAPGRCPRCHAWEGGASRRSVRLGATSGLVLGRHGRVGRPSETRMHGVHLGMVEGVFE